MALTRYHITKDPTATKLKPTKNSTTRVVRTKNTTGNVSAAISDASIADPTVLTFGSLDYSNQDVIVITGSDAVPSINGSHVITKTDSTHGTIPVEVTGQGTTGTIFAGNLRACLSKNAGTEVAFVKNDT